MKQFLDRFGETVDLGYRLNRDRQRLKDRIVRGQIPRIAFVKQDVHDDLYCCPAGTALPDLIQSTLLRPGPIALFSRFNAEFYIVETERDPECNIWQQKTTENQWCPLSFFESFRDRVPGRDYGQAQFARNVQDIDWGRYDLVISADVSVPARVTRRFAHTVWAYYVREIKTSAFRNSMKNPITGQDLFLNQQFRPTYRRLKQASHVVEFPYHLHYSGCFHEMFNSVDPAPRQGMFLEHHTAQTLSDSQCERLGEYGELSSTGFDIRKDSDGRTIPNRTMEPVLRAKLMKSKYFIKTDGRGVWGTAMIEAIAAGCLVISNPAISGHSFFLSENSTAYSFDEALMRLEHFEKNDRLYRGELERQKSLVDYLCYVRPSLEVFEKTHSVQSLKVA